MRKTLAFICYVLMLAADAAAGYFTYRAFVQKISYDQGLLTFVPLFILSYWFSTFFSQLIESLHHGLVIILCLWIDREHAGSIADSDHPFSRQDPVYIPCQCRDVIIPRHMLLFIQHALIDMCDRPSQRNIE